MKEYFIDFFSTFTKLGETSGKTIENLKNNFVFVLEFIGIAAAIFVVAGIAQFVIRKKREQKGKYFSTRVMVTSALLSAIAAILMLLELPVFFAPGFYKFDFSELPAIIGAFAFGPLAGVIIEFVKILLKVMLKGTSTAFVGELANFLVGSALILPASIIYEIKKSKKNAIIGCAAGTAVMTVFGTMFNAIYLIPAFARMFHMDIDSIVAMGTAVNSSITSLTTLVIFAVAPLNIIKGTAVSVIAILIYKPLRKAIRI